MLEVFRCISVPSFMVIKNSSHLALRIKHENANDAWIASLAERLRLKATSQLFNFGWYFRQF